MISVDMVVQVYGTALLIVIAVFSLTSGLYIAAEWLEDHARTSFRLIKRSIVICMAIQALWMVLDKSALIPNGIGLVSHLDSWLLLRYHPNHQNSIILIISGVILLVAHQVTWIIWWIHRGGTVLQITSVLAAVVWPVPTLLMLSSADSSTSLPVSINAPGLSYAKGSWWSTGGASKARRLQPISDVSSHLDQNAGKSLGRWQSDSAILSNSDGTYGTNVMDRQSSKRRKSKFLQGLESLKQLLKRHGSSMLPVIHSKAGL